MVRLLILVWIYLVFGTVVVFLLMKDLIKPMPWVPIFFVLMLAVGVVVLRSKWTERVISDPAISNFLSKHLVLVLWATICFAAGFYRVLILLFGDGDMTDFGILAGATIWGSFLLLLLRAIYRKNSG